MLKIIKKFEKWYDVSIRVWSSVRFFYLFYTIAEIYREVNISLSVASLILLEQESSNQAFYERFSQATLIVVVISVYN